MLESGLLLFFLVPGLLAYCALYGTFLSDKSIAPEPPQASSVETVTIILLSAAAIHVVFAGLLHANGVACRHLPCPIPVPTGLLDPYASAFNAMDGGKASGDAVGGLIAIALMQGMACYWGVRRWLNYRARRDRLPAWIYGWATDIANAADNDDRLILAYVMTNHDIDGKAITYVGVLYDLVLKADGCITRLTLWDCERYLADLAVPATAPTLPEPLSRFPFLMLEAGQIRNVAFEILDISEEMP